MFDFIMADKRRTTIFKQLILNVMVPPILALLILGFLNFNHTRKLLLESSEERNFIISDEIFKVLEFQDVALNLVEAKLDNRMHLISNQICNSFSNTQNIEQINLTELQQKFRMNPVMEDIYIIDENGIVVNTTFKNDLGLDFFSFGEEHKNLLLSILNDKEFKNERFAIEANTKRLKKYSYQATHDGKYIVELGFYSSEADEIIDFIKNTMSGISEKNNSIQSVDLFIGADHPFSLDKNVEVLEKNKKLLEQAFHKKDTLSRNVINKNERINYQFIYMDRKNTDLYKRSVVRIISDRSHDFLQLRNELLKFIGIFTLTLLIVIVLIYIKTKIITDPIKKLVLKVNRITHGHLNERADIIGNNEIATLSKQFNLMIEELESYYYELEQKVEDRTREIQQQKEEIASQRDAIEDQRNMLADKNQHLEDANKRIEAQKNHIMDSIVYAKRIQNAILPPKDKICSLIPNHFILYKPKDIVSGDFYWTAEIDNKAVIAAVDCTGHGVPGAFMSIIGSNMLNAAIKTHNAQSASEILNFLNYGVAKALQQEAETGIRDGMDISLLVIDYQNNTIEYSGAYNPLYLVRDNELQIIKADKFAIGSYFDYPEKKYTAHKFEMQKDDVYYIFSDGFADQFGGKNGRKYMYKRFREYLLSIKDEPLENQKELLDLEHVKWMGSEVQVDDIVVIGVKPGK